MSSPISGGSSNTLLQVCTRASIPFTLELHAEFEEWRRVHPSEEVEEFLASRLPPSPQEFPVYVKTLTGDLLLLPYRGTTRDLAQQLAEHDPETYPLHRITVFPLRDDPTVSVAAEDLFGVFVRPPSKCIEYITTSAWYDFTRTPWIIYHFTVNGSVALEGTGIQPAARRFAKQPRIELFVSYDVLKKTFSVRDYSRHQDTYGKSSHLSPMCTDVESIEALAETVGFYTSPTLMASNYTLTAEAQAELIALYDAVKQ